MLEYSAGCNCCMCESVCKYKDVYERGIKAILDTTITAETGSNGEISFWLVKDCPHIEVSIDCPHMIPKEMRNNDK